MNTVRDKWIRGFVGVSTVLILLGVGAVAHAETSLRVDAEEIRSYEIPDDFGLGNRIVGSTDDGRTLIANTTGEGPDTNCTVIVASGSEAKAFPYKHSSSGTLCVGVKLHPEGGFFVRGFEAGAMKGDVAGFTARIDAKGEEKWLVHDTKTAQSMDFKGNYSQPHSPIAYSAESGYLLTFTIGTLSIGNLDDKNVTHVSVLQGGDMRVAAKTIGDTSGFGLVGGVTSLKSTGEFLLYIFSPGSQGASFYTYDGRESVGTFEPLGEDWSTRFVRRMTYAADSNIYLAWTKTPEGKGPAHVSVVDEKAEEVWSEEYPREVELGGEKTDLGPPGNMYVGSEYVAILHAPGDVYLRVLDAQTGEQIGVAPLTGALQKTPLNILSGKGDRLKVLAVDQEMERFHELSLAFETAPAGGDAGMADGGFADAGGSSGGGGGQGGGCAQAPGSNPSPPAVALLVVLAAAARLRRGGA